MHGWQLLGSQVAATTWHSLSILSDLAQSLVVDCITFQFCFFSGKWYGKNWTFLNLKMAKIFLLQLTKNIPNRNMLKVKSSAFLIVIYFLLFISRRIVTFFKRTFLVGTIFKLLFSIGILVGKADGFSHKLQMYFILIIRSLL